MEERIVRSELLLSCLIGTSCISRYLERVGGVLDGNKAYSVLWFDHFLMLTSVVSIVWICLGHRVVIGDQLLPQQAIIHNFVFMPYLGGFNSTGRTVFCLCLAASSWLQELSDNIQSRLDCACVPCGLITLPWAISNGLKLQFQLLQYIMLPLDHCDNSTKAFYCIKKFKHGELKLPFMDEPFRAY